MNMKAGKPIRHLRMGWVDMRETLRFKVQQSTVSNVREVNRVRLKTGYWIWQLDLW